MGRITVVGSYVVDLMSRTPQLPKPGETVLGGPFQMGPGGKGGNQATAAARSGSDVAFVTKVGDDVFGKEAIKHFEREGFNIQFVHRSKTEATGTALIAVDDQGENDIVIAPGACGTMTRSDVLKAEEEIKRSQMVMLQLEISFEAIEAAIKKAVHHQVPVLLNPAPCVDFPQEWLKYITYATPNETEALGLTGVEVTDALSAQEAADVLHEKGVKTVVITLGKQGVFLSKEAGKGAWMDGFSVKAMDTTGAGDAFNGGFAHAIGSGAPVEEAVQFGQAVAALSVTKMGTAASMPTQDEIKAFLKDHQ